jgi:hypothetical protein
MIRIEDIVLNVAFLTARHSEVLEESPNFEDGHPVLSIGEARIHYNPHPHVAEDPHHFSSYVIIIGEKKKPEFSLIADLWMSTYSVNEDMVFDADTFNNIDYENVDFVYAKSDIKYLIKNIRFGEKLPINFVDSCYLMKYTWRGNIEAFGRELFAEKIRSNLLFYDYFADAVVTNYDEY